MGPGNALIGIAGDLAGGIDRSAVAMTARWGFLAGAGGVILRVSPAGRISPLAVLPPIAIEVSRQVQTALGPPPCVVGATYDVERVPSAIELRDGRVYVSAKPGGSLAASFGAVSAVFEIHPWTGQVHRVTSVPSVAPKLPRCSTNFGSNAADREQMRTRLDYGTCWSYTDPSGP